MNSSMRVTSAYGDESAAMKAAWTVAALIGFPRNSRSRVAQASSTRVQRNPKSKAARTVASTHMWLAAPHTTNSLTSSVRRRSSSAVSRKLLGKCLRTTISPSSGSTFSWILAPSVSGRRNVASGRFEICCTKNTGACALRKALNSCPPWLAASSIPTSSIGPPGK